VKRLVEQDVPGLVRLRPRFALLADARAVEDQRVRDRAAVALDERLALTRPRREAVDEEQIDRVGRRRRAP